MGFVNNSALAQHSEYEQWGKESQKMRTTEQIHSLS